MLVENQKPPNEVLWYDTGTGESLIWEAADGRDKGETEHRLELSDPPLCVEAVKKTNLISSKSPSSLIHRMDPTTSQGWNSCKLSTTGGMGLHTLNLTDIGIACKYLYANQRKYTHKTYISERG